MTDYSKLSDDEINSRVAETLPIRFTYYSDYIWNTEEECRFDPCNNPSEAWPILKEYCIDINWDGDSDSKPLRDAMIVYLMMKESDSAQG